MPPLPFRPRPGQQQPRTKGADKVRGWRGRSEGLGRGGAGRVPGSALWWPIRDLASARSSASSSVLAWTRGLGGSSVSPSVRWEGTFQSRLFSPLATLYCSRQGSPGTRAGFGPPLGALWPGLWFLSNKRWLKSARGRILSSEAWGSPPGLP